MKRPMKLPKKTAAADTMSHTHKTEREREREREKEGHWHHHACVFSTQSVASPHWRYDGIPSTEVLSRFLSCASGALMPLSLVDAPDCRVHEACRPSIGNVDEEDTDWQQALEEGLKVASLGLEEQNWAI